MLAAVLCKTPAIPGVQLETFHYFQPCRQRATLIRKVNFNGSVLRCVIRHELFSAEHSASNKNSS
jgi:hypothetical protein